MSAPQYDIITVDLSIPRALSRIIDVGIPIASLTILEFPQGAVASYALGTNRPLIPIVAVGQEQTDICPRLDEGLYFSNPAGAGLCRIYVDFSGAGASIGG